MPITSHYHEKNILVNTTQKLSVDEREYLNRLDLHQRLASELETYQVTWQLTNREVETLTGIKRSTYASILNYQHRPDRQLTKLLKLRGLDKHPELYKVIIALINYPDLVGCLWLDHDDILHGLDHIDAGFFPEN